MNPMTDKEEIKDGLQKYYHENGQLWSRQNYKNGKKDGLSELFFSKNNNNPLVLHGPTRTKGNYKNGKPDGLWESFHENGKVKHRENFFF